jgi:class I fructose-bisphosphate aldolase
VLPLILKANSSDGLGGPSDAWPAVTASVDDALRLGCCAIGFTIYPGSDHRNDMYAEIRELAREAKSKGLAVVVWSYPRGHGLDKAGETAVDVVAYAAQLACLLGAHVVKVKPPSEHVSQDAARKVLEKHEVPLKTLADRVRHVVRGAFGGHRIVIFSGGEAKDRDAVLAEIRGIRDGGGFGSIVGRNSFQRPRADGVALLRDIMSVHAGN